MWWNDERLSWKIVEKWPIYFLPLSWSPNGFSFRNQRTAVEPPLEGRAGAENTGGCRSGEQTCCKCDKEAFHVTRPGVNVPLLRGHRELLQNMSRSGRGQSGIHSIFPSLDKNAYAGNQYEDSVRALGWWEPGGRLCDPVVANESNFHPLQASKQWLLPGQPGRQTRPPTNLFERLKNERKLKNPRAINQSQSSRTAWQSAHITGRQAHIRYAFQWSEI